MSNNVSSHGNRQDFRIFGAKIFPQSSPCMRVFLDPDNYLILRRIIEHGKQRVQIGYQLWRSEERQRRRRQWKMLPEIYEAAQ